jgi:uncharacterized protein (UPF0335 family)
MKKIFILSFLLIGFVSCQNETKKQDSKQETSQEVTKPSFDQKAYKMKGKKIAMGTFKIFKGKIESVGKAKGLHEVVNFCHKNAVLLTDSIGKANKVEMTRTSHKLRNSDNKPNADQQAIIENYLESQEMHKELAPMVMKDDQGYVHFYAPIKLKNKCLQCHGQPGKDINDKVLEVIKENYPKDKATGFREGELRGIWDIKFLDK